MNTLYVHVFMFPHMCVVRGGHVTIIKKWKNYNGSSNDKH